MEYLSAIAYNFRISQGPYVLSKEAYDEEDSLIWIRLEKEVCANEFGIKLTREDVNFLKLGKCLKGKVINYYMQLIVRRSHSNHNLPMVYTFDTLFFSRLQEKGTEGVLSSLKSVQLFAKNILFLPIHTPGHWALVKVWTKLKPEDTAPRYLFETTEDRSHEANSVKVKVDVIVDRALKIAARNRSIFSAATEGVSEEVLYALDKTKLYERLCELGKKVFPQGPTDPASLLIPEAWMNHVDCSPFVIYDSSSESNRPRIIVMSSDYMLQKLSESTSFATDGTFFAHPRGWRQLYTIHIRLNNTFIPAVAGEMLTRILPYCKKQ
uniref:Ubiquitin-like protease family profile domain-containing protein n=1 Tax=Ditylenchus dipsaci TaxID=166011 RepID=A0A915D6F5_9BILA